ncbi:NACHT domain-containing protein [Cryptosporangium phraense]|uniref:NACHT N-terminal Helical domain-containing protein n=1 Tax=Cryptosporangium phraense TaxID=2593070 RepID=A0A545AH05_9ACTN|nr:hypothetical protein [Cryptosporangium phraense]TQS39955.1 hypothetical protein FL583_37365 [Cryptosporangium phraense]
MGRTISVGDAVRLLGGDSTAARAIDALTGGLLLGAVGGAPALLGWLDVGAEFARLGRRLLRSAAKTRGSIGRVGRTERVSAAHTVIVVAAYFEAMAGAPLPARFSDLELTRSEQLALAGSSGGEQVDGFVTAVLAVGEVLPSPHTTGAQFEKRLGDYYQELSNRVVTFMSGLEVWDRLSETDRARWSAGLADLPTSALRQYRALLGELAADFPELRFWADQREHHTTQEEVRRLEPALASLQTALEELSGSHAASIHRDALSRAHRGALGRSIVESGELPIGLTVPTLEAGYVPPRFRVAPSDPNVSVNDEDWWIRQEIHEDLGGFFLRYLTSPTAIDSPIVLLGQPGAGKSVLTKVLAARLPASDYLPVRVVLRDVAAEAGIQEQVEQALLGATGDRMSWPSLVRSASGVLPVLLMDGFDELLQATGVRHTDYLARVNAFQLREAEQGRPLAIIVTSRLGVADQARTPAGTLLLRLEPFDESRVRAWAGIWNDVNSENFAVSGTRPLDPDAVLAYPDLAEQPLLLLMLALHDADANALSQRDTALRPRELYERLLGSFARREVVRQRPYLSASEVSDAVEDELRRLALVAFAAFNRASQWVTESDLEGDLTAVLGGGDGAEGGGIRAVRRPAEIVLGRFFFIHRARALRHDVPLGTYEFLHATFGEYLVARLTWQLFADTAARAAPGLFGAPVADDDLLYALLSYAALAGRGPVVQFLDDITDEIPAETRPRLLDLLVRLHRVAGYPRAQGNLTVYQPRRLTQTARHAAYSANLVLLAICIGGDVRASDLFDPADDDVVSQWHNLTLLWHSQLSHNDYSSLVDIVALDRLWPSDMPRDVRLFLRTTNDAVPPVDTYWTYAVESHRRGAISWNFTLAESVRRRTQFQCGQHDDILLHLAEPMTTALDDAALTHFYGFSETAAPTAAHALVRAWLPGARPPTEEPHAAHEICADIVNAIYQIQHGYDNPRRFAEAAIAALAADDTVHPDAVADLVEVYLNNNAITANHVGAALARCLRAHLNRCPAGAPGNERLTSLLHRVSDSGTYVTAPLRRLGSTETS